LAGILDDIGWVQSVIVNRSSGFVVDGHLRVALALQNGQGKIPVTYVDVTEEEENRILLSFDFISSLAVPDREKVGELMDDTETDSDPVRSLFSRMAEQFGIAEAEIDFDYVPPESDSKGTAEFHFTVPLEYADMIKSVIERAQETEEDDPAIVHAPSRAFLKICQSYDQNV
jgi:hypothetical protein